MGLRDWLFGGKKRSDEPVVAEAQYPWDRTPSIYQHVRANIEPGDQGLSPAGQMLPDEERLASNSTLRWAAGAMDGVLTHHMAAGGNQDDAGELLDRVRAYWQAPAVENKARVYEFIVEKRTVSLVDPFVERLQEQPTVNHQRLYELARSFAMESTDREPVKFGVALLGLFRLPQDREIFLTLGRHDEFTLFCAVALKNADEDAEDELWQLAKQLHGWGRVHLVERLAGTENPEIKAWLLREGYKNKVLYEYLAYTCAATGELRAALAADSIDEPLLDGAGEIIQALIAGGPAQSIDDYDDAGAVAELYLRHVNQHGQLLPRLLAVAAIKGYAADDKADWPSRAERGWTAERRRLIQDSCEAILARESWRERILEGLRSSDEQVFHDANRAAEVLGIATWQVHWNRLCQSPTDATRWFHVMKICSGEQIDEVVKLAEERLPLDQIASGPAKENGLGPEWQPHNCLGYILQYLGRFPGRGVKLIDVGLRSPVVGNRNGALAALAAWGKERWPAGIEQSLQGALPIEPEDEVRERIQKVLSGEASE